MIAQCVEPRCRPPWWSSLVACTCPSTCQEIISHTKITAPVHLSNTSLSDALHLVGLSVNLFPQKMSAASVRSKAYRSAFARKICHDVRPSQGLPKMRIDPMKSILQGAELIWAAKALDEAGRYGWNIPALQAL